MIMQKDMADNMKRQYKAEKFIKTTEREVRTVMGESCIRDRIKRDGSAETTLQRPSLFFRASYMAVVAVFFCFLLAVPQSAEALTSGPNDPTSATTNNSVGTWPWSTPSNVYTSNRGMR